MKIKTSQILINGIKVQIYRELIMMLKTKVQISRYTFFITQDVWGMMGLVFVYVDVEVFAAEFFDMYFFQ